MIYLLRWEPRLTDASSETTCYAYSNDLTLTTGFLLPVSFWFMWQLSYVYFQFTYLDKHPELVISQRYLVADGRKTLTKYGYKFGIYLGMNYNKHVLIAKLFVFYITMFKNRKKYIIHWRVLFLGLFDPNHLPPDPFAKTTTIAFVCFSMIMLPATMIHPCILYYSEKFNIAFLITVFISALWRGATYYIHIFSQRYNAKFETNTGKSQ